MESPYTPRRSPTDAIQFRIICPSNRTGAVIGKGGSTVRQIQSLTGAKIRLLDDPHVPPCDDRVIVISSHHQNHHHFSSKISKSDDVSGPNEANEAKTSQEVNEGEAAKENEEEEGDWGPVQKALVRVFEKVVKGDSEEELSEGVVVTAKILIGSNQMGYLLRIVDKIQAETGSQVRVLPREQIPPCAFSGDELVMVNGSFIAVRKALLSVSICLQHEAANLGHTESSAPLDLPQRGYATSEHAHDFHMRGSYNVGPENTRGHSRMINEKEVVFRVLCQQDKVGSLIGKGGTVIRAIENETGAFIKIADPLRDSDERVVAISARENSEQRHSPAQDAVIRVQTKIAEIGFDPGAAVVARLLVHQQQIGFLLGKGGHVVAEIRQLTGASIRIFPKEQAPKYGSQNYEVVQVVGSLQSVQDALFHVTSRLREFIFPIKAPFSGTAGPPFPAPFPEMHAPHFRPGPNPASPGSYPPVGPFHSNPIDHPSAYPYGMDGMCPPNMDRGPYPYGGERSVHGPPFECSPRSWTPQPFSKGSHRRAPDASSGLDTRSGSFGSGCQTPNTSMPVEVYVPQKFLAHVYGENNSNLNDIRQVSGANVIIHEPELGCSEGLVILSGTPAQIHIAQSLVHAFILWGKQRDHLHSVNL